MVFKVRSRLFIKVMFYVKDKSFLHFPKSYNYKDSCEVWEEDERLGGWLFGAD